MDTTTSDSSAIVDRDEIQLAGGVLRRIRRATGFNSIDGEEHQLVPGRYVFVAPGCLRSIRPGADGMRLLALGAPAADEYSGRRMF